jgi:hypothetical protein
VKIRDFAVARCDLSDQVKDAGGYEVSFCLANKEAAAAV